MIRSDGLKSLQALRGISAIAVALYHSFIIGSEVQYGWVASFGDVAKFGFLGVAFFFVLSGFIILMAHENDFQQPNGVRRYVLKRVLRIFPTYWVYTLLFVGAAAFGLGNADFSWSAENLGASFLLFPLGSEISLPLQVAWTLVYEVRFYIIFGVFLYLGRKSLFLILPWVITILYFEWIGFKAEPNSWSGALSVWNLYFVAGILAFWGFSRLPVEWGPAALAMGVAGFLCFFWLSWDVRGIGDFDRRFGELHYLLAVVFGSLVWGFAASERVLGFGVPRALSFIGDASYSIYLVHSAVISLVFILAAKIEVRLPADVVVAVAFLLSVLGGMIAYLVIERPLLLRLRRILL